MQTNIAPKIVNGRLLLPLRATFGLFGTYVDWQPKTKTIKTVVGDKVIEFKVNQKQAKINGSVTESIFCEHPPVIISNNLFVPIRSIADIFNSNVQYDQSRKRVSIQKPLVFKNNKWYVNYFANKSLLPIEKYNYLKYIKQNNIIYFVLHVGDLTMYEDVLYALDTKGNQKQIFTGRIRDFRIEGKNCYYIHESTGYLSLGTLMKVNLSNPSNKIRLGNPDFVYDAKIKIRKNKDDKNVYFNLVRADYKWEIKPDGIYIIAFNGKMITEDQVVDLPLLEQSHGYYLVDKNGQGQKLVGNIKINNYLK